jgi:hypothetical protein
LAQRGAGNLVSMRRWSIHRVDLIDFVPRCDVPRGF